MPREFNGRIARLLELREDFDGEVQRVLEAGGDRAACRQDPGVIASGMKLARCQRAYNLAWSAHTRTAGRQGVAVKAPTAKPRSTEDFLALLLAESRSQVEEARNLVAESRRRNDLLAELVALKRAKVRHSAYVTHVQRS